eukprot:CAMPEP_0170175588 /NCGR_PEP_ID=MMETSP0040_2-20121228/8650_1 /TAXON_ID=641309 /ORGANISM="Lotharella oceanica, Strain CCMP622" /LENGTH=289 /DNA_ID=CAMNT_0010417631 /DNA_START=24 /DNA_END=893 /DNA_ORIENTATION=-
MKPWKPDWITNVAGCAVGPNGQGFANKHKDTYQKELDTRIQTCLQPNSNCFSECAQRAPADGTQLCDSILNMLTSKPGALYAIKTDYTLCIGEAEGWNKHALVGQDSNVLAAGHVHYEHTDEQIALGRYNELNNLIAAIRKQIKDLDENTPDEEKGERVYKDKKETFELILEMYLEELGEFPPKNELEDAVRNQRLHRVRIDLDSGHYHPSRDKNAWSDSLPVWRRCGFQPYIDQNARFKHQMLNHTAKAVLSSSPRKNAKHRPQNKTDAHGRKHRRGEETRKNLSPDD